MQQFRVGGRPSADQRPFPPPAKAPPSSSLLTSRNRRRDASSSPTDLAAALDITSPWLAIGADKRTGDFKIVGSHNSLTSRSYKLLRAIYQELPLWNGVGEPEFGDSNYSSALLHSVAPGTHQSTRVCLQEPVLREAAPRRPADAHPRSSSHNLASADVALEPDPAAVGHDSRHYTACGEEVVQCGNASQLDDFVQRRMSVLNQDACREIIKRLAERITEQEEAFQRRTGERRKGQTNKTPHRDPVWWHPGVRWQQLDRLRRADCLKLLSYIVLFPLHKRGSGLCDSILGLDSKDPLPKYGSWYEMLNSIFEPDLDLRDRKKRGKSTAAEQPVEIHKLRMDIAREVFRVCGEAEKCARDEIDDDTICCVEPTPPGYPISKTFDAKSNIRSERSITPQSSKRKKVEHSNKKWPEIRPRQESDASSFYGPRVLEDDYIGIPTTGGKEQRTHGSAQKTLPVQSRLSPADSESTEEAFPTSAEEAASYTNSFVYDPPAPQAPGNAAHTLKPHDAFFDYGAKPLDVEGAAKNAFAPFPASYIDTSGLEFIPSSPKWLSADANNQPQAAQAYGSFYSQQGMPGMYSHPEGPALDATYVVAHPDVSQTQEMNNLPFAVDRWHGDPASINGFQALHQPF